MKRGDLVRIGRGTRVYRIANIGEHGIRVEAPGNSVRNGAMRVPDAFAKYTEADLVKVEALA